MRPTATCPTAHVTGASSHLERHLGPIGLAALAAHPLGAQISEDGVTEIEPTWESMAADYQLPDWFVDGKLGVWFCQGPPISIDEDWPHDGSHCGAWMYGTEDQLSASKHPEVVQRLTGTIERYGHYFEFG